MRWWMTVHTKGRPTRPRPKGTLRNWCRVGYASQVNTSGENFKANCSRVSPYPDWTDQAIRELARRVCYFLRKKFSDLEQATLDDLTQEVMQAAYVAAQQNRFQARDGARFETFVLQIARHKAADFLRQRRRRREAQAPLDLMVEETVDLEFNAAQADLLEQVKQAVAALSERHAQILRFHFYQGWKIKEIAQELALSEQEVSNLKSYALRKVRERLEKKLADVRESAIP